MYDMCHILLAWSFQFSYCIFAGMVHLPWYECFGIVFLYCYFIIILIPLCLLASSTVHHPLSKRVFCFISCHMKLFPLIQYISLSSCLSLLHLHPSASSISSCSPMLSSLASSLNPSHLFPLSSVSPGRLHAFHPLSLLHLPCGNMYVHSYICVQLSRKD